MTGRLPDPGFWRSKRVLLTGHTGFKGAWLAIWLQRLGAEVTGFALPPETPSLGEASGIERRIASIRDDIRDFPAVQRAFEAAASEIVLHLAAQAVVRRSYRQPVETFAANVMGTVHVLEAARQAPHVRAVVCVTSDKCYENQGAHVAYREADRLGGHDPYSASKACAELAAGAWRRSFLSGDTALATARAGNVIGGGDWGPDRLVPDCVRAFAAGEAVAVRNPGATRPWQHVLDPLCGYLLLAEQLWLRGQDVAEAWNFGPPVAEAQPVSRVVRRLVQIWGDGAAWQPAPGPHPFEATQLAIDASLAYRRLDWHPRLDLEPALDWTASWYKNFAAGADAGHLVEADIARYEAIR
jgi:CDP-glucose 4,6-dehydratase